jgi:hypothetical protein
LFHQNVLQERGPQISQRITWCPDTAEFSTCDLAYQRETLSDPENNTTMRPQDQFINPSGPRSSAPPINPNFAESQTRECALCNSDLVPEARPWRVFAKHLLPGSLQIPKNIGLGTLWTNLAIPSRRPQSHTQNHIFGNSLSRWEIIADSPGSRAA